MQRMSQSPDSDLIPTFLFTPAPDTSVILNHLLDIYERRGGAPKQAIRVKLNDLIQILPGYYSQTDPFPRTTTNQQLLKLARQNLVHLTWEVGQEGHLLETVTLELSQAAFLYKLLKREPLAEQRQRLRALLLGNRARLDGWRKRAVQHILNQLKAAKSPTPFSLTDTDWNQDLLAALLALPDEAAPEEGVREEIPYRVFSVRLFNDSKRFDVLKTAVARLARRHQPIWRDLSSLEVLRELGLVSNPGHLYLSGPWQLVDDHGQVTYLADYYPSVGIPAALAASVQRVSVDAPGVICVENLTPFYELIRYQRQDWAAICLWGNPSPACRHLLHRLAETLPLNVPLYLWADIDYGGLNILAHLRQQVSHRFVPCRMDRATLDAHARWAHPLSSTDERNLTRLKHHPALEDVTALIDYMLARGLKLEQEAVMFDSS